MINKSYSPINLSDNQSTCLRDRGAISTKGTSSHKLIDEVMYMVYPSGAKRLEIEDAEEMIVWINDEKYIPSVRRKIKTWYSNRKKIIVINSCKEKLHIRYCSEYHIKNGTEGWLSLGYMNFIINEQKYIPDYLTEGDRTFDAFRQFLQDYSLEKVSAETGLLKSVIEELYEKLSSVSQSYHWLAMSMTKSEVAIQKLRSIILMTTIKRKGKELLNIPVFYEREGDNFHFTPPLKRKKRQSTVFSIKGPLSIIGFKGNDLFERYTDNHKVSFYDWDFADYFDVDPLPHIYSV
ncbi:hypothetical protein CR194_14975 [Salipaludibacillus keqinensis]|uniref:Uncharacterized protein n=1 Tax=Salipaludibacillus keqinensis TaxID=2045207 RepID=A0A323TD11_9BACI|nr:hypothetical protein [Salipaludibacillus keqinensis]PYZ92939.1 hypothetical protein CR194_14975 [Salipaludibacillus keqinensis]